MEEIWAVEPIYLVGYLERILNISEEMKQNPKAFFGDVSIEQEEIFSEDGDTATINIKGLLSQDGPSFLDRLFGFTGTAYGEILEAVAKIQENNDIKTIRMVMDTPGGEVAGVDKVFQAISELGKSKTVIAESHGLIASAGYWIASAAGKIVATSPADEIGSIGVVVVAIDFSKAREECGIKVVVIRSKNAPNKYPDVSTEKGKSTLQERVDATERVFIGRISEGRGIAVDTIEKTFARGSVLIAEDPDKSQDDALSVGMIDDVESSVLPAQDPKDRNKNKKAQDDPPTKASKDKEENPMDLKEAMADVGLAQEITARDNENIKKGANQEREQMKARIEKCKGILASEKYGESVKNLAVRVISGESEYSALEAAVCAIDAQKEGDNSAEAKEETDDQKETSPDTQDGETVPEGICETNEQFEALQKKEAEGNC